MNQIQQQQANSQAKGRFTNSRLSQSNQTNEKKAKKVQGPYHSKKSSINQYAITSTPLQRQQEQIDVTQITATPRTIKSQISSHKSQQKQSPQIGKAVNKENIFATIAMAIQQESSQSQFDNCIFQKYLISTLDRYCLNTQSQSSPQKAYTENDIFDFIFGGPKDAQTPQIRNSSSSSQQDNSFNIGNQPPTQQQRNFFLTPQVEQIRASYKGSRQSKPSFRFKSNETTGSLKKSSKELEFNSASKNATFKEQSVNQIEVDQQTKASLKPIKEHCFLMFRTIQFHQLLTINLNSMQPSEFKVLKVLANILILFNSNSQVTAKFIKTKQELIAYLGKEKLNIVNQVTQMIINLDQQKEWLPSKSNILKSFLKKIQRIKLFFNSSTNSGKLLTLLQILSENYIKIFDSNNTYSGAFSSASPRQISQNLIKQREKHSPLLFDFQKISDQSAKKSRIKSPKHIVKNSHEKFNFKGQAQINKNDDYSNDILILNDDFLQLQECQPMNLRKQFRSNTSLSDNRTSNQNIDNIFISKIPSLNQTGDDGAASLDDEQTDNVMDISPTIIITAPEENEESKDLQLAKKKKKFTFGFSINIDASHNV